MVRLLKTGVFKALNDRTLSSGGHHQSSYALMRRLIRESIKPYAGWIFAAVFFMIVVSAATGMSAWLMEPIVDDVFIAKNRDALKWVGIAVLATFTVKGAANYAQASLISRVGLRVIADNQNRLFAHLSRMDLSFFHNNATGSLISRFTVDIGQMRAVVSNALTSIGKDLMSLIALVTVMFYQNWELALIAIVVFPVAFLPIVKLGRRMRKVTANTQAETGLFMTLLEQTFQGIRVVKAYGMEEYEKNRMTGLIDKLFDLTFKSARTRALSSPIMETLGGVAVAIVIIYGGNQVIDEAIKPGAFFSFITALLMAYEPMKRLANLNASVQEGLAGAERLFNVLDVEPAIIDRPGAKDITGVSGNIEFDHVTFSYDGADRPALNDISLSVPAGQRVALVGMSGGGKSTILNMIPRFYDVGGGSVRIDNTDVRDATMASLHANIALVSQEIMLFDDTVRANIAYGRAGATEEEIIDAARHAVAHDFIVGLSDGYDTIVGEQGVKLSGGQRQRLAIARAMLKNAPILLLDEATSALDTESERQVQAALEELMSGRTSLVIAHRLSTVVDADLIYVIEDGKVREKGRHSELVAKDGIYAKLYALQFNEESTATNS